MSLGEGRVSRGALGRPRRTTAHTHTHNAPDRRDEPDEPHVPHRHPGRERVPRRLGGRGEGDHAEGLPEHERQQDHAGEPAGAVKGDAGVDGPEGEEHHEVDEVFQVVLEVVQGGVVRVGVAPEQPRDVVLDLERHERHHEHQGQGRVQVGVQQPDPRARAGQEHVRLPLGALVPPQAVRGQHAQGDEGEPLGVEGLGKEGR